MTKSLEINCTTGEIIERDLTQDEIAANEAAAAQAEADRLAAQAEAEIKAQTRQAVLDKLGLSADEVAALLG